MRYGLVLASLLLPLTACGDKDGGVVDCTQIGCTDGLEITLDSDFQTQGSYEAVVLADGETLTCTAVLPLPSDGGSSCDAEGMWWGTSGSALEESEHRLLGWYLPSGPAEVSLSVTRDTEQVLSAELSPEYEVVAPNGEECGPVCTWALETVSNPAP